MAFLPSAALPATFNFALATFVFPYFSVLQQVFPQLSVSPLSQKYQVGTFPPGQMRSPSQYQPSVPAPCSPSRYPSQPSFFLLLHAPHLPPSPVVPLLSMFAPHQLSWHCNSPFSLSPALRHCSTSTDVGLAPFPSPKFSIHTMSCPRNLVPCQL